MLIPGEPRFISGLPAINQYLADFVIVPPSAYPAYNATGATRKSCFVQLTVSPFGTIDEVKILQGFSKALDQEIIRQVKKMPLWIPAINRDIPVSTIMTMKYTFQTLMVR
jgi:outer membrane biosynthesis protein TonB